MNKLTFGVLGEQNQRRSIWKNPYWKNFMKRKLKKAKKTRICSENCKIWYDIASSDFLIKKPFFFSWSNLQIKWNKSWIYLFIILSMRNDICTTIGCSLAYLLLHLRTCRNKPPTHLSPTFCCLFHTFRTTLIFSLGVDCSWFSLFIY